jgi:Fur family ferric uptake transcriptional regulator
VYRALERLAKHGSVSVSDMGTGAAVYESLLEGMHHHLVCQTCGHVEMIDQDTVNQFFSSVEAESQFQVSTNHLILFGICGQCRKGES